MADVGAQSTQLDFHQAMRDFRVMFPDMDANVIEVVLRSNHGAVHATIDQLLTMSTDLQAEQDRTGVALQPIDQHQVPDVVPGRPTSSFGAAGPQLADCWETASTTPVAAENSNSWMDDPPHFRPDLDGCEGENEQPPSYALFASPPPTYQQAVPQHSSSGDNEAPAARSVSPTSHTTDPSPPRLYRQSKGHRLLLLPLPLDFLCLPHNRSEVSGSRTLRVGNDIDDGPSIREKCRTLAADSLKSSSGDCFNRTLGASNKIMADDKSSVKEKHRNFAADSLKSSSGACVSRTLRPINNVDDSPSVREKGRNLVLSPPGIRECVSRSDFSDRSSTDNCLPITGSGNIEMDSNTCVWGINPNPVGTTLNNRSNNIGEFNTDSNHIGTDSRIKNISCAVSFDVSSIACFDPLYNDSTATACTNIFAPAERSGSSDLRSKSSNDGNGVSYDMPSRNSTVGSSNACLSTNPFVNEELTVDRRAADWSVSVLSKKQNNSVRKNEAVAPGSLLD